MRRGQAETETTSYEARRVQRRAASARVAILRAQGKVAALPPTAGERRKRLRLRPGKAEVTALWNRVRLHTLLVLLVGMVLAGEGQRGWSQALVREQQSVALAPGVRALQVGVVVTAPLGIGPVVLERSGEAEAPALSVPREVPGAFQATHQLSAGETLGDLATRYGITVETLVLANRLEQGDALLAGQLLQIPHVSGVSHIVRSGETLAGIAEQYGVSETVISTFPGNQALALDKLVAGSALYVPGAQVSLSETFLRAVGGIDGLARRGPERAGIVQGAQTNLREGPSVEHSRLLQLDAGRRVALEARHKDWLLVTLGPTRGWVRADMLDVAPDYVAALPETNDFPAPPPRWVWPARGTITSRFGPRWRSFHNGLDIANRAWTPIVAARSGIVKEAGWCSGYGYCVKLRHDGGMETIYGHLIDEPPVKRGDEVLVGELIGYMGSTYDRAGGGYSTGVHLHLTVLLNGKAVDPLRFLP